MLKPQTNTPNLAHDLRVMLGKLVRRLREEARLVDLTWPQLQVLGRLDRDGPQTLTQLARAEGMRSQSMGETVAALKARALINGAPDPADGRQTVLSLTDEGRDLILASRASREDWLLHRLNDHLTAAEEARLAAVLPLLQRLTDE
jgi:DNA-binding MarR family transcriptional regulator